MIRWLASEKRLTGQRPERDARTRNQSGKTRDSRLKTQGLVNFFDMLYSSSPLSKCFAIVMTLFLPVVIRKSTKGHLLWYWRSYFSPACICICMRKSIKWHLVLNWRCDYSPICLLLVFICAHLYHFVSLNPIKVDLFGHAGLFLSLISKHLLCSNFFHRSSNPSKKHNWGSSSSFSIKRWSF